MGVEPKIGGIRGEHPQIIHLFIGFSIIFTIHFGVPLFLEGHPYLLIILIQRMDVIGYRNSKIQAKKVMFLHLDGLDGFGNQ